MMFSSWNCGSLFEKKKLLSTRGTRLTQLKSTMAVRIVRQMKTLVSWFNGKARFIVHILLKIGCRVKQVETSPELILPSSYIHLWFVNINMKKKSLNQPKEDIMKNGIVFLIAGFICFMAATMDAHAMLLQGPDNFSSPYPSVLGQPINVLPPGFVTINVGDEIYYYCSGVFYQMIMRDQQYVVVPPPIGAVVFNIPQGYQLMLINGTSYYEYQGVYYKRVLEGYKVINPPV